MSDLIRKIKMLGRNDYDHEHILRQAADRIETLEAQNKALFAALARLGDPAMLLTYPKPPHRPYYGNDKDQLLARIEYANTENKRIEGMGGE